MKVKRKAGYVSLFAALCMILTFIVPNIISVTDVSALEHISEIPDIELISLTAEEAEDARETAEANREQILSRRIPGFLGEKYSSNRNDYFYNQMTDDQKSLYDKIIQSCENLLNSDADAANKWDGRFLFDYIILDVPLPIDDVTNIIRAIYYSEPQYFFLECWGYYYSSEGFVTSYAPVIQSAYAKGNIRSEARSSIQVVTNEWMSEINKLNSDIEKEKWIARKLCETITYKKGEYEQTIAGALIYKECVCNGYTMAMTYFCNLAGIPCVYVRNTPHAWNRVCIDGVWYEIDVTWMDHTDVPWSYIDGEWCNKSHSTFLKNDSDNSHKLDGWHDADMLKIPDCTEDYTLCSKHTWDDYVITQPATASDYGYKFHACKVCTTTEIKYVCPTDIGHYWNTEYEFDREFHWQICYTCGDAGNKAMHSFTDDVCRVCGYDAARDKPGDLNGDGEVNNRDAILMRVRVSQADPEYDPAADLNGDGQINNKDVILLRIQLSQIK